MRTAVVVVAVLVVLSGCVSSLPVTRADTDSVIVQKGVPADQNTTETYGFEYAMMITDLSDVDRQYLQMVSNTSNDRAVTFLKETDFERSTVVVYQHFSTPWYPHVRIERVTRDGKHVTVVLDDDETGGGDGSADTVTKTVLVRVNHGPESRIASVSVRYPSDQFETTITTPGVPQRSRATRLTDR